MFTAYVFPLRSPECRVLTSTERFLTLFLPATILNSSDASILSAPGAESPPQNPAPIPRPHPSPGFDSYPFRLKGENIFKIAKSLRFSLQALLYRPFWAAVPGALCPLQLRTRPPAMTVARAPLRWGRGTGRPPGAARSAPPPGDPAGPLGGALRLETRLRSASPEGHLSVLTPSSAPWLPTLKPALLPSLSKQSTFKTTKA